jgi:hypothetical protein
VNGDYDALRVLIGGHRPLVCASIAFWPASITSSAGDNYFCRS